VLRLKKQQEVCAWFWMKERISMKIQAMGRAVMELSLADLPMTQQNIIDKLKQYRKETGNVTGKEVNRDAAEIVRKGQ
jgi:hypothetical protein